MSITNAQIGSALETVFREAKPTALLDGLIVFDMPVLASVNLWSLVLSLAAAVALFRFKVDIIVTLIACSAAGIGLYLLDLIGG